MRSEDAGDQRLRSPRGCIIAVWVATALLVLALVFALAVDRSVAGRVEREIAALRAAGKPVTAAEAAPPLVAAADNAAPLYEAAAVAMSKSVAMPDSRDWRQPQWLNAARAYLVANSGVLPLMTAASGRSHCRFDASYPAGPASTYPEHQQMRELARLSWTATVAAALEGDRSGATQRGREGLVLARHMSQEPGSLGLLVTCASDAIAIDALDKALATGPVSLSEARSLSLEARALDYMGAYSVCVVAERSLHIEAYALARRAPTRNTYTGWYPPWSPQPPTLADRAKLAAAKVGETAFRESALLWADELKYLRAMAQVEKLAPLPWRDSSPKLLAIRFSPGLAGEASIGASAARLYEPIARKRDEAIARRGLLQAALAVEQYKAQHGVYPDHLAQVRIEGLPIPDDVFSGSPLVYRRSGDSFVLYSIGPNLRDNGGKDNPQTGDLVWEVRP